MKTDQIAAQLYTCRDILTTPAEIARTLGRIRAVGYTAVEIAGLGEIGAAELRRILGAEGLAVCGMHADMEQIRRKPDKVLAQLLEIGCPTAVYAYPSGVAMDDLAGLETLIRDLESAARQMAAGGVALAYHNHGIEFVKIDGVTALDRIYDSSKNLQAEPDSYWIHYGGGNVVDWCRKLAGRMPLIHLKDYTFTMENRPTFCEVGAGTLDFKAIVRAAEEAGCRWFVVEQDTTPGDPVDSLKQSYNYLVANVCEH